MGKLRDFLSYELHKLKHSSLNPWSARVATQSRLKFSTFPDWAQEKKENNQKRKLNFFSFCHLLPPLVSEQVESWKKIRFRCSHLQHLVMECDSCWRLRLWIVVVNVGKPSSTLQLVSLSSENSTWNLQETTFHFGKK